MNLVFFGSSDFSIYILDALLNLNNKNLFLKAIVSNPPRIFGRDKILKDNKLVAYVKKINLEDLIIYDFNLLKNYDFDLGIVASYGKIIPLWLLNKAKFGFINFHGSLLPRYRGAIPIQATILNNDYDALGITLIKMDENMDTGDIILHAKPDISYETFLSSTTADLISLLGNLSYDITIQKADYIFDPIKWSLIRQNDSLAVYCYERDLIKNKFEISINESPIKVHGKIMAGNPEPKAFLKFNGMLFNLLRSNFTQNKYKINTYHSTPFFVFDNKLFLSLKESSNLVEIIEIQPQGKKLMTSKQFINGYKRYITEL